MSSTLKLTCLEPRPRFRRSYVISLGPLGIPGFSASARTFNGIKNGGIVKHCICILLSGLAIVGNLPALDEAFVLNDATPIRIRLNRNLSSTDATVGENV